jgi:hypothetical protein
VAYFVGLPGGLSLAQGGPVELQLVPRDAAVVAYADVRDIMASDLRQQVRRAVPVPDDGQRRFQEQTGIDIESDIDHVVAALQPQQDGQTAGFVLARGRFDAGKIEASARSHGADVQEYGGTRIIAPSASAGDGRDQLALAFVEPGLVAIGHPQLVRGAIDRRRGGENVTANAELMDLIASLETGNAWAVGRLDALRADGRLPAQLATRLPAIRWFSVTTRVDADVRGMVRADARDEAAANDLRDVVRGFLALAKLQAGARPDLRSVVESLELGGTGRSVSLSFVVPGEAFEGLRTRKEAPAR